MFEYFEYLQIGSVLNRILIIGLFLKALFVIYGRGFKLLDADLSESMPVTFVRAFLMHSIASSRLEA